MNVIKNVILLELYFIFLLLLLPLYDCQRHKPTFITRPPAGSMVLNKANVGGAKYWHDVHADGMTAPRFLTTKQSKDTTIHPFLRETTTIVWLRSLPDFISTHDYCDYIAVLCLEIHRTGRICARTVYYIYHTFINYCNLEYINCMEGFEVWQISHTGDCYYLKDIGRDYMHYGYIDDFHLDQYYVQDDW